MSQSSVIFFVLFAAFVIFITQKGELPTYLGLLLLSPPQGGSGGDRIRISPLPGNQQTSQSDTGGQVASYVENNAATAAQVFLLG